MRMVLAMIAAAMLAACGEQKRDIKDTVFAPQVKAMEKARAVEDKLKQGAEKNREAVELSEKATPPEQQ